MPQESDKKLLILYIYDVLKNESDEDNPLKQKDIIDKVKSASGITCNRKTIKANIDALNTYFDNIKSDLQIIRTPKGKTKDKSGFYLSGRALERSMLQFLVDAIYSNRGLSAQDAKEIANILMSEEYKEVKKKFEYILNAPNIARTRNRDLFLNIEIINEAIEQNKKIKFLYLEYDMHKELVPRHDGKEYAVSPYFMLNSQGRYFLVCKRDDKDDVGNFKIDRLRDIKILNDRRYPFKSIKGYEKGITKEQYINENPLVFGGERITTILRIHKNFIINDLVESFGTNVTFLNKSDGIYAYVQSSAKAIVAWVFQYGEAIEIVAPASQVAEIKELSEIVYGFYHKS